MFDFTETDISKLTIHHVGNKLRDENIVFSTDYITDISNDGKQLLLQYFLKSFTSEELFSFFHSSEIELNEVFNFASKIFKNPKKLLENSVKIANHLYDCSYHPKIKGGEFYIAYFNKCKIGEKIVDAIGLFKSEVKEKFIKVDNLKKVFTVKFEEGSDIKKIDKGCLIFNLSEDNGFIVSSIDNISKADEAKYWKDDFLSIKPLKDEYHFTNHFLKLTKQFITTALPKEFEISKTDQVDLLNKSVNYFKENETFDIKEFQKTVFEDKEITKSFRSFGSAYSERNDIDIADRFEISDQAVKKQVKAFKSVLKLDKNFHIYIHGDKELIEKGFDKQKNMNYYKVYFKEEQ